MQTAKRGNLADCVCCKAGAWRRISGFTRCPRSPQRGSYLLGNNQEFRNVPHQQRKLIDTRRYSIAEDNLTLWRWYKPPQHPSTYAIPSTYSNHRALSNRFQIVSLGYQMKEASTSCQRCFFSSSHVYGITYSGLASPYYSTPQQQQIQGNLPKYCPSPQNFPVPLLSCSL